MSATRVDYFPEGHPGLPPEPDRPEQGDVRPRLGFLRWSFRFLTLVAAAPVLAVAAIILLVRGGVFAHQQWDLGPWQSLGASGAAAALLLALYAWVAGRRLGAGKGLRKFMVRLAVLAGAGFVAYSLLAVSGGNVKSAEVRAEYQALHPLLRMGVSAFVLFDQDAVITDAARSPDFYERAGLPPNESSLHFRQSDGFVHALDLRTVGRPDWRNQAAELAFGAMGFHVLRHTGTADHLHVSLRRAR